MRESREGAWKTATAPKEGSRQANYRFVINWCKYRRLNISVHALEIGKDSGLNRGLTKQQHVRVTCTEHRKLVSKWGKENPGQPYLNIDKISVVTKIPLEHWWLFSFWKNTRQWWRFSRHDKQENRFYLRERIKFKALNQDDMGIRQSSQDALGCLVDKIIFCWTHTRKPRF